jgi:predicted trehalose synthase
MKRREKVDSGKVGAALGQVHAAVASGSSAEAACRAAGITTLTYYRWCKAQMNQVQRLEQLEIENARLRRVVSQLCLEKLVLKELAAKSL